MFRFILFSALVAVAFGGVRKLRSPHPQLDGRIVGGEDVEIDEYPYQVSLLWYGSHICGGSLVGRKHVVTAAHCTDGFLVASLSVRVGSSIRNSEGEVIDVAVVHQHPDFDDRNFDFDVSVLELVTEITDEKAKPIVLPEAAEVVADGTDCFVSGWGAVSEGGPSSNKLQAVVLKIVSREVCSKAHGVSDITDRMLCAGVPEGGKDACQRDSGGPLVVEIGGVKKLVGVVSWGIGCARPEYPGVYAKVLALLEFIEEKLGP